MECPFNFRFEQSVLTSQLGLQNGGFFWIGLSDLASPGEYTWSDGSPVTYTHWDNGMPGNCPLTPTTLYVHK